MHLRPRALNEMRRKLPLKALGLFLIVMGTTCIEAAERVTTPQRTARAVPQRSASEPFRATTPTVAPSEGSPSTGTRTPTPANDTGSDEPLAPLRPVLLTLTLPDGTVTELGEFEPHGDDMGFSTRVSVPPGTPLELSPSVMTAAFP